MSETLRRIVNVSSFPLLQEKLDSWLDTYHLNTTSQNVDRCQAALEVTGRLHSQLVDLLTLIDPAATYSGLYDLKYHKWPYYPYYRYPHLYPYHADTIISAKNREIAQLESDYENNIVAVEDDLQKTQLEADDLKNELEETRSALAEEQRKSVSDKMFTESENAELRAKLLHTKKKYEKEIQRVKEDINNLSKLTNMKETLSRLRSAEDELVTLRTRVGLVSDYERTIRNLRDDIAILTGRRSTLTVNGPWKQRKSNRVNSRKGLANEIDSLPLPYKPLPRAGSPFSPDDVTQRVRQSNLIQRYEDLYYKDRVDAMDTLRRFSDDNENNQRIIFAVVQEAFSAAKLAFTSFKQRVRSNLLTTFRGPGTLEEEVQDYINRNTDLYSLPDLVADVVRALNRNVRISLPADVSYTIIQPFIREACKVAWGMSALAFPIDVGLATDSELYEDSKYRRSYDSEYSAPLVNHHIWPCLKQGLNVLLKGEACTRRGASLTPRGRSSSRSRTPTRSRSVSPLRAISPARSLSRARSRSPSPTRKLESSLSGRLSPGRRSMSPSRSRTSSRAITSSTSLSHYGVSS